MIFLFIVVAFLIQWIPGDWWVVLIVCLLLFAGLFIILNYILDQYITKKLIPIYRVIRKSGTNGQRRSGKRSVRPMEDIYNEVDKWTETKNTEIAELKANAQFRQEFIGNVSHELKTPIFNIQGYILTLLEGGLEDPAINRLYLERAEKSINRMIQIVEDLEYIARIESGELQLDLESFNICKLVDEVFELHEMRARKNKIRLIQGFSVDKEISVIADRKRILGVMSNLVINGIHYGKKGGLVKISVHDMVHHVLVEVSDDGLGIAEEDQKRIFERFYRVDKSRSRDQGGTGLGLSIVKHFIELHGQTINLQSTKGEGSTFTFTLEKA